MTGVARVGRSLQVKRERSRGHRRLDWSRAVCCAERESDTDQKALFTIQGATDEAMDAGRSVGRVDLS